MRTEWLRLAWIAVFWLAGVCAFAQINTDYVMMMGRNALYYEDYVLSIQRFNMVINSKPFLSEPYYYRGLAKFYLEDYSGAELDLDKAVERNPYLEYYYELRGLCRVNQNKFEAAEQDYRKVTELNPMNEGSWHNMALCQIEQEGYERADSTLNQMIRQWPRRTENFLMKSQIAFARTDTTQALEWLDRILEQDQDDAQKPMLYAQYLHSKGKNKETMPVLEQVLDIDPTNTAARMTLLGEAVRKEDYKEVIRLCEAGVESNPDMLEFYFYLAIAYNQAERADDALAVCQKALGNITEKSKKEVVSDFYAIMGDIYHTKKMNAEAYAAYDSALVYNSANIGAMNNYAYYLSLERRDLDKAEEMSYKTVKAEPNNSTYLDTYAWILFEKGNYAEARLYIDDAMKNEGDKSDTIVEHCGDIYYMTGDVDGALKYWKQAQEMGSESKTLKNKIEKKK